jgi:type I restriction enzyme S subunit
MQAYPEYKDSGFEWLGKVPSHWDVARAKFLFSLAKRPASERDGIVTAFRDGQVTLRKNRRTDGFTNAVKEIGYQGVRTGDLVIHAMDAFAGAVGVSDSDGKCSPVYSCCIPDEKSDSEFYAYLVRTMSTTGYIESLAKGIRERSTDFRWKDFYVQYLPHPPLQEQLVIKNYLSKETARIDNLIAEKQNFINLLKEKRQALISHVFKIDEEAQCAKLGYFVDLLPGYAFKSEEFSHDSSGIRLLRGVNVGVNILRWDEAVYWPEERIYEVSDYEMKVGDIVFGMDRPWIKDGARVAVVTESDTPSLLVQRVARIRAKKDVLQEYLYYALSSDEFKSFTEADLTGVSVPHISPDQIKNFPLVQRGLKEQEKVVENLNIETKKIDGLLKEVNESIELLAEHRTALISAAVTGKIDVRDQV